MKIIKLITIQDVTPLLVRIGNWHGSIVVTKLGYMDGI
jgi:hypothetical protein